MFIMLRITSTSLLACSSQGLRCEALRSLSPAGFHRLETTRQFPHLQAGKARAASVPLPLPNEFGYVALTAAVSAFIVQWQAFQVSRQRAKSGVPYPKMYEDAEPSLFNCYQRAHQNTLENYPSVLALLAIGGLAYPVTCSAFGMLWNVGRIVYSLGYYTGDPKNRLKGMFHFFGFLGLLGTCVVLGFRQTGLLSKVGL